MTGDIFNWLNSDDYYNPNTFDQLNQAFKNKEINAVLGKSRLFDNDSNMSTISKGGHLFDSVEKTIGDSLIDQPSAFFKTEVFRTLCPLNESLRYLMDRAFWMNYLLRYGQKNVLKTNHVYTNFRLHDKSKTVSETSGFNTERNALFQSLAYHFLDSKLNDRYSTIFNASKIDIDWGETDLRVEHIINEFFLVLSKEFYAERNYDKTNEIIRLINPHSISKQSLDELKLLSYKSKLIPKWLLNQIRKIRS